MMKSVSVAFVTVCLFAAIVRAGDVAASRPDGGLVLENALYRIEFERDHGRLLRLLDKKGQIDLKSPPELAENFRLIVPRPDEPRNFVLGKDQPLSRVEASQDKLSLYWDGPMKDERGRACNVDATMSVAFDGDGVAFRFRLVNRTAGKVQEVWYPVIGGLQAFGPPDVCAQSVLNPPPHHNKQFQRPFGEYLVGYPSQNMGFVEVDNPALRRGMYLGAHDPVARFKAFHFRDAGTADNGTILVELIHYPFTPPGGTFEGSPVVMQFHGGDWIAGGREIYRPWFIRTFGLVSPEQDWIRQHGFFQMVMIMLPEGNINYTCRQIPQIARDGLKYGVRSLQIAGWQFGGHDNGYPYYEPDPRLGTWDDMKEAIRACHEMGVKIYFFANIVVANVDTEWYQRELKDYNYETVKGAASWIAGWGMGTLASRMAHTTPLMSFVDPSFPGLADGQLRYFKKLAEVGADGIHLDKSFPQAINFNPRIGMSPDQAPWEGAVRLVERISRECRAIRPDFRISFEAAWDRFLSYGAATWWAGNMSVARRIFPELVETVGLYQPYDYLGVNDAVRNGWAVMVSPHHFNRTMDYESWRGLSVYIRDVKVIRDELADYVFTGEVLDVSDAAFADQRRPAGIEHAVYRNLKTGKRAAIVTNRGAEAAGITFAGFGEGRTGTVRAYRPAEPASALELPASIVVGPERLVILVEN